MIGAGIPVTMDADMSVMTGVLIAAISLFLLFSFLAYLSHRQSKEKQDADLDN